MTSKAQRMHRAFHSLCLWYVVLGLCGNLSARGQEVPVQTTLSIYIPKKQEALVRLDDNGPEQDYTLAFEELWIRENETWKPIRVSSNQLSEKVAYQGPPELILYRKDEISSEELGEVFTPVYKADLESGSKDYLLIARENKGSVLQRLIAIPIDPTLLPRGNILTLNVSSIPLSLATEHARIKLSPQVPVPIDISSGKAFSFKVMAAVHQDDGYRMVYRRIWHIPSQARGVCLFFPMGGDVDRWESELIML